MTHTYVVMELSQEAYDEIAAKMREAGYDHAFHEEGLIDMHGIAVQPDPVELLPCFECKSDYLRIATYPPAKSHDNTLAIVRVECASCGYCGPIGSREGDVASAVRGWNEVRRP